MEEHEIVEKAKKKVKAKKDFFAHLMTFVGVMVFLFVVNLLTSPDFWWVLFPFAGWGMSVLGHYFSVFGFFGFKSDDWEQKEIAKEMDRMKQQKYDPTFNDQEEILPDDRLELKERIRLRRNWKDDELV